MQKKISFIIPVFNAGPFLIEAVNSILHQSSPDVSLEILLVDDCSTDQETRDIILSMQDNPSVQVIRQPVNGGPAKARNAGIRAATGDWIGFLDADDILAPGTIHLRLKTIAAIPDCTWLLGDILEIRKPGELTHENHFAAATAHGEQVADGVYRLERPVNEMLDWNILPVLGAMLIRRDVFDMTGLLGESLVYGEDIHFCLVMATKNDLFWSPVPVLYLRRYHESMTKDTFRGACEMPKSSAMLLQDPSLQPYRKRLRWMHSANLRLMSDAHRVRGNRWQAFSSAIRALRWSPNDKRNLSAISRIFFS